MRQFIKRAGVHERALVAEQQVQRYTNFVVLDPQLKYGEENEIKVIATTRRYPIPLVFRQRNLSQRKPLPGDKSHIRPDGLLISTSGNDAAHEGLVTGGDTVSLFWMVKGGAQAEAAVKEGTAVGRHSRFPAAAFGDAGRS